LFGEPLILNWTVAFGHDIAEVEITDCGIESMYSFVSLLALLFAAARGRFAATCTRWREKKRVTIPQDASVKAWPMSSIPPERTTEGDYT
jgi:hypothetical protein